MAQRPKQPQDFDQRVKAVARFHELAEAGQDDSDHLVAFKESYPSASFFHTTAAFCLPFSMTDHEPRSQAPAPAYYTTSTSPPPNNSLRGKDGTAASPAKKPTQKKYRRARPLVLVLPNQFGSIDSPNQNDVLSGRGGRINYHSGNVNYRKIINPMKERYMDESTKKLEKAHIAAEIVFAIRAMDPPGRFLTQQKDGRWTEIGDARAFKKVGQALREAKG